MGSSFTFHVPKDKPNLIELFRKLSSKGELSDFLIESAEMHKGDILRDRYNYHSEKKKYWAKLTKDDKNRMAKEKLRREKELKKQIKITERYLNNMVEKRRYSSESPAYATIARYIEEDSGLKLSDEQVADFYQRKLRGEEINLLEELLTTGGSQ